MQKLIEKYYRSTKLPHIWCPGCGHGVVTMSIVKAIDKLQLDHDKTVIVSGIGCSSRASGYLNFDTVHSAHGRALPVATGIKLSDPELNVIVITGDGDATAIGGNHFIHAARRNINLTMILYNNNIYGMTGGQYSPLTPVDAKASTAPFGTMERNFDIAELAKGAGATFVARSTAFHTQMLTDVIAKGIAHKGFSLVEAMTQCPTSYGRQNKMGRASDMLKAQRDNSVTVEAAARLTAEQKAGKFLIGVLHQEEAPEYTEQYDAIIAKAQKGGK